MSISLTSVFMRGTRPFKVENILALTTDGASNNSTMAYAMEQHWQRFAAGKQHMHCFAHILNILAQLFCRALKEARKLVIPDDELLDELQNARYAPVVGENGIRDMEIVRPQEVLDSLPEGFAATVEKVSQI